MYMYTPGILQIVYHVVPYKQVVCRASLSALLFSSHLGDCDLLKTSDQSNESLYEVENHGCQHPLPRLKIPAVQIFEMGSCI